MISNLKPNRVCGSCGSWTDTVWYRRVFWHQIQLSNDVYLNQKVTNSSSFVYFCTFHFSPPTRSEFRFIFYIWILVLIVVHHKKPGCCSPCMHAQTLQLNVRLGSESWIRCLHVQCLTDAHFKVFSFILKNFNRFFFLSCSCLNVSTKINCNYEFLI